MPKGGIEAKEPRSGWEGLYARVIPT